MQDDSDLYTGMMGNDVNPPAVDKEIEQQKDAAATVAPSADIILTILEAERDAVSDIRSYLQEDRDGEKIKDEFRARELYLGFLSRLETQIRTMLGDNL